MEILVKKIKAFEMIDKCYLGTSLNQSHNKKLKREANEMAQRIMLIA